VKTRDPRSVERLDVYRNATLVGSLQRTTHGAMFEYDRAFFEAHHTLEGGLATHLPYAQRTIETRGVNLHTYFAGLLPEGLRLRALVARAKTSEDDQFTLLVAAGADCVGDLFPVLPGARPNLEGDQEEPTELDRISFASVFQRTLDSDHEPVVAGVQEKLSPSVISFPFATAGKRWILKLNPADKPRLVENEHFFMTMAKACGLDVAKTRLVHDRDGAAGLLVERFDRKREGRQWRGIHQEDACQFLDRYPADKYRLSTSDLAQGLGRCPAPVAERARLIEVVAFSYLVGNGDLHGKNVSLSSANGSSQLSPAYDLLSTRPYKDLKLALKFEGRDDNVKRAHFIEFGRRFGVPPQAVEARLDRITSRATPFISRLGEIGFDGRSTKVLTDLMKKRLAELR
jgi:serine/threonine-protein kinase HipA